MTTERLDKIEEDLDALTTIVAATARHSESAQESFGGLNDRSPSVTSFWYFESVGNIEERSSWQVTRPIVCHLQLH